MIIGMMTRTARGHTARPLRADRVDVACYVLVLLGALVRVAVPLLAPAFTVGCGAAVGAAVVGRLRAVRVRYWPVLTPAAARRQAGLSGGLRHAASWSTRLTVLLSVSGFVAARPGVLRRRRLGARARCARTLPHLVDTVLLASALAMAWMLRLNPLTTPWLAAKIVGLLLYIALGMLALRPGRPLALRVARLGGGAAELRLDRLGGHDQAPARRAAAAGRGAVAGA